MTATPASSFSGIAEVPLPYLLPYTPEESQRLDLQHDLITEIFGGLTCISLTTQTPLKILDVGCGTGAWAMAMAKAHPSARVYGVDSMAYVEWQTRHCPPNCEFLTMDVESKKHWASSIPNDLVLIHIRFMTAAIRDWEGLLASCQEHLSRGGWLELREFILPIAISRAREHRSHITCLETWNLKLMAAMHEAGLRPTAAMRAREDLQRAGFSIFCERDERMFLGGWPENAAEKRLGKLGLENYTAGIVGFGRMLCRIGMDEHEIKGLVEGCMTELRSGHLEPFLPLRLVIGQNKC